MPFLAELLNPPDEQQAFNHARSIVDADNSLDGLDDLTSRKHDLESKLALSSSSLDAALNSARSDLATHYSNVLSLSQTRDELDESFQTLAYITDTKPSLLQDLETLFAKLTELEHLRSYISVIHHALTLSEKAVNDVRSFLDEEANAPRTVSMSTLKSFSDMQTYIASFRELTASGDGELSLSNFLDDLRRRTWNMIRGLLSDQLLAASEKIQWPKPVPYASFPQETRVTFELAFLNLLHLQELGEKGYSPTQRERLYPLSTLITPIAQRFKYHFDTPNRPTNRIDKPEWFMTHILNVTHEHKEFIGGVVKHLIGGSAFKVVDAKNEWISLLLPLVRRKLRMVVGQCITADPPRLGLVAHALQQALVFDKQIEEEEGYRDSEDGKWGVSWEVLGRSEWFETWVDGESAFANDQYNNIISSPDAWTLQPDSENTTSSTRLTSLLTSSLLPYTPLPLSHQPPFLLRVTLPILEMYHDRIKGSLDAFDTLSGMFGSMTIPGQMGGVGGAEMTRGVEGVGKVVKGWVSARALGVFVGRWEEEIFFIELWQHILDLGITHRLLPSQEEGEGLGESGVFGVILSMYDALQVRAEEIIIRQITGEVEAGMKEWFNWQYEMMAHPPSSEETEPTQPLLAALQILLAHLSALPNPLRQSIYKSLAESLTTSILKKSPLLQRHRRTTLLAGKAFKRDVDFWVELVVRKFGRGRVWRRLEEVGVCISLESESFERAEEVVWNSNASEEWRDGVGIEELDRERVRGVLKCREESKY